MKKFKKYMKIILGCLLIAVTLNLFFVEYDMIPAGIFGFATLYNARTGINLALIVLLANLFFFILGFLVIPKRELKKTIIPFLLIPLFIILTQDITFLVNFEGIEKILLALYGGVLMGLGLQFIYKENNYASGTDIITLITKGATHEKIYLTNYIIDSAWVIFGTIMYGFEGSMYSLIAIMIMEYIAHRATLGISESKVFYIITKKDKEVRNYIIDELGYDLTIFDVKGGFLKTKNKVLMCVIPTKDYYKLREGIKVIDNKCFISITDSYEVVNENKTLRKKNKSKNI